MKLTCRFVSSRVRGDWETLRRIRNSCLDGLTGSRHEITPEQQDEYRETYDREMVRHFLFFDGDRAVGFARIEQRGDYCVPSLGVAPWARGQGFGREIVRMTMMLAGAPMRGELFIENKAIQKIDYSLGWRPVGEPVGDVQPVECSWPPPFTDPAQQAAYDEIVRYHEDTGDGLA